MLDNRTEVTDIWMNVTSLTAQANGYFGQEIFNILDIITLLLDRQQSEITNNRTNRALQSFLPLQISTTVYGAETMDNLISNDYQWGQLQQVQYIFMDRNPFDIYYGNNACNLCFKKNIGGKS